MNTTLIISIWGATLSTLLGILTILDRIRSRPIIRTSARIGFRRNAEKKYATARFKNGPYGEISEEREIFVELRIENHGNKPMTMKAAYVEERNGQVNYIYSDGLPCLLEGQSSATFSIQKEFFDGVDISANERIVGEVKEAGVVDTLDRRYPINRRNLARLLKESFDYPTTIALFVQKGHPDRVVASFPIVDRGAISLS